VPPQPSDESGHLPVAVRDLGNERLPRGQRPCTLVMLVEVPVSLMKTSVLGSSRGWPRGSTA